MFTTIVGLSLHSEEVECLCFNFTSGEEAQKFAYNLCSHEDGIDGLTNLLDNAKETASFSSYEEMANAFNRVDGFYLFDIHGREWNFTVPLGK